MQRFPADFAHGFLLKSESGNFHYKCSDFYMPEYERVIHWADEALFIDWPFFFEPLISKKGCLIVTYTQAESFK